jgi:hypothetical protein
VQHRAFGFGSLLIDFALIRIFSSKLSQGPKLSRGLVCINNRLGLRGPRFINVRFASCFLVPHLHTVEYCERNSTGLVDLITGLDSSGSALEDRVKDSGQQPSATTSNKHVSVLP